MDKLQSILEKDEFSKEDIIYLLSLKGTDQQPLFDKALEVKRKYVGNKVYFRGLVEFSNKCDKNCYYCGIRAKNKKVERYELDDAEILDSIKYAFENKYASVVLQSGERTNKDFINKVDNLLKEITKITKGGLGITLSCGEQSKETYQRWFDSGAHRYLLRIESSTKDLYYKIHPEDKLHDFESRLQALRNLKDIGYQTGTGVMIGMPNQTLEHLADDILFFKNFDIDMVGMGPYLEHADTPMYAEKDILDPVKERFFLSLRMIAILRIMMKDINIASSTALQAIDPMGREKAIKVGANIIMPNLTTVDVKQNYLLYEGKPCLDEDASECKNCLEARITLADSEIGYDERGDSKHYFKRRS